MAGYAAWRGLALIAWCCASTAAAVANPNEDQRIQRERREAAERYADAVAACNTRFAVSGCIERARAERRATLDHLRQQQSVLDDARRRERAAQRLRAIEDKTSDLDARGPEPAPQAVLPRPARAAPGAVAASAAAPATSSRPVAADTPDNRPDNQRRAAAAERRRSKAEKHRQDVLRRNAEHDRTHPKAAPLPVPPSASSVR